MNLKSHFTFTKQNRNGIFLLLVIIVVLQCAYFYIDFTSDEVAVNDTQFIKFQNEIDSLRLVKLEETKPKIKSFNPNYITDFKGSMLGMSNEEINRLLEYRKQNKWINSAEQFQEVTQVSDSLLSTLVPYFKFPEWVTNKHNTAKEYQNRKARVLIEKKDLNKATAEDLEKINGVGEVLSNRIIRFRNTFPGGFIADVQLQDVKGLKPEVIENILDSFTVRTPRGLKKINLNKATVDELVTIQHVDYHLAKKIIEYRVLFEGYKSLDELIKVKGFPANKIEIIKLYLQLEKEN